MKEAGGVVNSRDRYLLGALNSAQGIVKGEQYNSMNTVSHMGYKTHSKFWKSLGMAVTGNFLVSWCDPSFAICRDAGGFWRGGFCYL